MKRRIITITCEMRKKKWFLYNDFKVRRMKAEWRKLRLKDIFSLFPSLFFSFFLVGESF